jgi:hypothetical protein
MIGRRACALLALFAVGLIAGRWRMLDLDDSPVAVVPAAQCAEGATWALETQVEGFTEWAPLPWFDDHPPEPGDCIAHPVLNVPSFRSCCRFPVPDDDRLEPTDPAALENCAGAELHAGEPVQCARIFDYRNGREYSGDDVVEWNQKHSGG